MRSNKRDSNSKKKDRITFARTNTAPKTRTRLITFVGVLVFLLGVAGDLPDAALVGDLGADVGVDLGVAALGCVAEA